MARRSVFRRIVSALIVAPATIILVVFAVSNRQAIMLSLWPLSEGVAIPLYLLVLALLALGAVAGMLAGWLSGAKTRRRLREAMARAERAEREAAALSERLRRLEQAAAPRAANAAEGRSLSLSG
jgi:uncharacterized integral membrane protein